MQIFALVGASHESPPDSAGSGGDSGAIVVQELPPDAGNKNDTFLPDTGVKQDEDAGAIVGIDGGSGSEPCLSGTFKGTYECDYEGLTILVKGDLEFTIGAEDVATGTAPITSGSVYSFLPRTADDPTPVAQFPTVELRGLVTCGQPPQLVAETGPAPITSASDLVTALLSPTPVTAELKGPYDTANGGYFSGSCIVYGPPNCIGTFRVKPVVP